MISMNLYSQDIPQYNEDAEVRFEEGLVHFQKRDYTQTKDDFEKLIKDKFHQRTTASYLMLSKTYWHLNDYQGGIKVLKEFIDKYPESNYVDDALYTKGLNFIGLQEYELASLEFVRVLESTNDPALSHRSFLHLEKLTKLHLSTDQLSAVLTKVEKPESRELVNILIAQKYYYLGELRKSKSILEPIFQSRTISKYLAKAHDLWRKLSKGLSIKICGLLPLMHNDPSSPYKGIGEDILMGIEIGVDEFNTKYGPNFQIDLNLRDTEKNSYVAAKELEKLAKDEDIIAVVGPVFTNEAQACAEVNRSRRLPMVSPTATGNGIAEVSEYCFQANPDFINRGRAMAIYAVKQLGLINLAVISPDDPSSRIITENFISEVEKIGGKIIDAQWYQKGSSDLSDQLKYIRRVGLTQEVEPVISFTSQLSQKEKMKMIRAGANLRLVDSLIKVGGSDGVNRLFGKRGKQIADSLNIKYTVSAVKFDSLNIPVNSIHGIFIPISAAEEIGVLTSQIYFYNIKTQILGTSEWYDEVELDQHAVYTDGTIFYSEFFIENSHPRVAEFLRSYTVKFNKTPSRYSFFGYDALSLILNQMKSGPITRDVMQARLASIKSFNGLHSKITLSSRRINSELHILKYINGTLIKIGEVDVSKD